MARDTKIFLFVKCSKSCLEVLYFREALLIFLKQVKKQKRFEGRFVPSSELPLYFCLLCFTPLANVQDENNLFWGQPQLSCSCQFILDEIPKSIYIHTEPAHTIKGKKLPLSLRRTCCRRDELFLLWTITFDSSCGGEGRNAIRCRIPTRPSGVPDIQFPSNHWEVRMEFHF